MNHEIAAGHHQGGSLAALYIQMWDEAKHIKRGLQPGLLLSYETVSFQHVTGFVWHRAQCAHRQVGGGGSAERW